MRNNLKIVMLGSRGVGKTSALSAMWHELETKAADDNGVSLRPTNETFTTLQDKWGDVLHQIDENKPFLSIDVGAIGPEGTADFVKHKFVFKAGKNECDVTFVDSAGGYTENLNPDLVKEVNEALGVFFVVDAAKLTECDNVINNKANNPLTLKQIIANVTEDGDKQQPTFITFVLTKCESYMDQKDKLFEKFSESFDPVIKFIKSKGMKVYYLPVQTIGCVVFRRLIQKDGETTLEFKKRGPNDQVNPVDALYPLKLIFKHLIGEMAKKNNGWFNKILEWIGVKEDVKKYYQNLEKIAPQPLDFREL